MYAEVYKNGSERNILIGRSATNFFSITSNTTGALNLSCPTWDFTGLCHLFVWVFVPNIDALPEEVSSTKALLETKFPFSYISSAASTLSNNSYNPASSTELTVSISLPHTTTSTFGNFMPSTFVAFSTSTVQQYMPSGFLTTLRTLMKIALYAGTVEMIYFGALQLIKPDQT